MVEVEHREILLSWRSVKEVNKERGTITESLT